MVPSIVQVLSVTLAFEMATIILWEAGVRSSTRKRRLSSAEVGLGRFFLCLSSAILSGFEAILMMTWAGPLSLVAELLNGLKHDSKTVAYWGTLEMSLVAFAAVRRGLRTRS